MPTIDLASPVFWIITLIAVAVMTPVTHAELRKWLWAGMNLVFIATMLQLRVLEVAAYLVAAYLALRVLGCREWREVVARGGLFLLLCLFVINKMPGWSANWGTGDLNPLLAAVGFSYVFLRLVDVGRVVYEGGRPPPDLASTVNYLLPFHMLAAGPIQSYEDFIDQPTVPKPVTAVEALEAVERIALGLFKKFVVAYIISKLFLTGFSVSGPYMLFEVQAHYLWFYLDFSGYSDIAVGIGRLMGVRTPENFDKPYLARNMIDFWDRWHISLSLWVRRNLFIPMQLAMARRTRGRRALLIATVAFTVSFLLCGLWHGISWPYFAWGAMHALGLVVTNSYRHGLTKRLGTKGVKAYKEKLVYRLLGQFITFQWVAFSLLVIAYPWKGFEP
ncbi:MAG: MBOAT family O-acyltransferase [Phycisphaerales bacterium]